MQCWYGNRELHTFFYFSKLANVFWLKTNYLLLSSPIYPLVGANTGGDGWWRPYNYLWSHREPGSHHLLEEIWDGETSLQWLQPARQDCHSKHHQVGNTRPASPCWRQALMFADLLVACTSALRTMVWHNLWREKPGFSSDVSPTFLRLEERLVFLFSANNKPANEGIIYQVTQRYCNILARK